MEHFRVGTFEGTVFATIHFFSVMSVVNVPRFEWTHVALTYDGITARIYMNGEEMGFSDIGWPISADVTPFTIGAGINEDDVIEFHSGMVDEVRLYDVALSQGEVEIVALPVGMGNLISNPGFEDGVACWSPVGANGSAMSPGHSGAAALYVTSADSFWRQGISPFVDDATYRISGWGKGGADNSRCMMSVQYWNVGNTVRTESAVFPGNNWVRAELNITVPVRATGLRLVTNNNGETDCAYDDFEVILVTRN